MKRLAIFPYGTWNTLNGAKGRLLTAAANSPGVRRCSPASYSTIIQRTWLMAT
jgi:hypothetical protein